VNRTIRIAPVHKSVVVQATPAQAFEVFTSRIDRWWPKSKGIGAAPIRESLIEPFEGGRWYTKFEDGTEAVVGHVLVWRPGERFVVSWEISAEWKSDARVAFASEVEVRFLADTAARDIGVSERLTVNARAAGPRLGRQVQAVIAASKAGDWTADSLGVVTCGGVVLEPGEFTVDTIVADGAGATATLAGGAYVDGAVLATSAPGAQECYPAGDRHCSSTDVVWKRRTGISFFRTYRT